MNNAGLEVDLVDAISYSLDNGALGTIASTGQHQARPGSAAGVLLLRQQRLRAPGSAGRDADHPARRRRAGVRCRRFCPRRSIPRRRPRGVSSTCSAASVRTARPPNRPPRPSSSSRPRMRAPVRAGRSGSPTRPLDFLRRRPLESQKRYRNRIQRRPPAALPAERWLTNGDDRIRSTDIRGARGLVRELAVPRQGPLSTRDPSARGSLPGLGHQQRGDEPHAGVVLRQHQGDQHGHLLARARRLLQARQPPEPRAVPAPRRHDPPRKPRHRPVAGGHEGRHRAHPRDADARGLQLRLRDVPDALDDPAREDDGRVPREPRLRRPLHELP